MNLLIYAAYKDSCVGQIVPAVERELNTKATVIRAWDSWGAQWRVSRAVRDATHVLVWNGNDIGCTSVIKLARHLNKHVLVFEWGWTPQTKTLTFDAGGLAQDSSLCGPIPRIGATSSDYANLLAWRVRERSTRGLMPLDEVRRSSHRIPDGPIAVPLQVEHDSTILYGAQCQRMTELIEWVRQLFPDRELRVIPHPKFKDRQYPDYPNVTYHKPPTWRVAADGCAAVVGFNSGALVECGMLGMHVRALADCPIKTHGCDDLLFAAYLARQAPTAEPGRIRAMLDRFYPAWTQDNLSRQI